MTEKLVRDRIPEIIEAKGEKADYYVAGDEEYLQRLRDKLLEEAEELCECIDDAHAAEELADVWEVLEAIMEVRGYQIEDIAQLKAEKKQKRGGFSQRFILKM